MESDETPRRVGGTMTSAFAARFGAAAREPANWIQINNFLGNRLWTFAWGDWGLAGPVRHRRQAWRRGRTVIAKVAEASWIRSTGMVVVLAALRGGLAEPKRAMEVSCPRGSWRAL